MFDLSQKNEVRKKDKQSYSPFPEFSPSLSPGPRIDLLPRLRAQQQAASAPKVNFIPSNVTSQVPQPSLGNNSQLKQWNPSLLDKIGSFFSNVKEGILPGAAESIPGTIANNFMDKIWQKSYENAQQKGQLPYGIPKADNTYTSFTPTNAAQSIGKFIGSNVADAPLWMLGDAALAKPLGALATSAPILKAVDAVPDVLRPLARTLTPAIGTGIRAGSTYGGVIAPLESLTNGENLNQFLQREKQVPLMAAGGAALHGAGQLIGKGIGEASNALLDRRIGKMIPPVESNPLQDVQNAYRTPINLRDVQSQQLNNTFADTTGNLGQTGSTLPRQGMSGNELLQQNRLDAQRAFSRPPISESIAPQGTLPEQPSRLTWANRDNIPSAGQQPIRSITPENVGQLPGGQLPFGPRAGVAPAITPTNIVDAPIGPAREVAAAIERNPAPSLSVAPVDNLPGGAKTVGAEPIIPAGMKESGVGKNIRTDANRNPELRSSLTTDPSSYKELGNKATLTKAQSIWDEGLESSISQLDDLIKNIQPEAAPLVKMVADELFAQGNSVRARELLSNAMNRATETGQFGQAFRILRKEADPATLLMTIDKQLKKLNKEGLETYGKKWNNVDLTPDELTNIGKIERGNQKSSDEVFDQILARIADEMPATGMEKFIAWRHIAMLLNTTTNIRNVGGNALMMAMRKATQRVEGVLQKATPKAGRTQAVFVDKEYKQLATDYFKVNEKELLSGGNKYRDNITMGMEDKRVFRKSRIGEKFGKDIDILEKTRKLTYDLLQKGDTPFFRNAYVDRLASYAQAKGIKDFSKLGQEGFDIAKKEALEATYKDMNVLATSLNKFKRPGLDASNLRKGIAAGVEVAFPFVRTPINLIHRGVDYTPLSLITGFGRMVSKKSAIAGINDMAKGMVGTGIVGLGYMLAGNGILTGKSPKDKDLREYNSATERAPFSIMGKYSFDWALPISIPLIIGVEIYNATHESEEEKKKMDSVINGNDDSKLWTAISNTLGGVSNSIEASAEATLNMSMLQTLKRLIGNPKGYLEGVKDLPKNLVSQMIPSMLGKFAAMADPLVRTQYVQGDRVTSLKNAAIAKIPFASKTLQPKQTPFGEDVKNIENIPGRVFSRFLSPGIIAKDQNINPKIDTELRRLNNVAGLKTQFPTMVPNYIEGTQTHPRINLTPDETTQYQKRVGQLTLSSFGKVMNSDAYLKTNDDAKKADLLAKAISDAKAIAKEEILKSQGIDTAKVKAYSPFSKSTDKSSTDSPFASQKKDKNSTSPFK